MKVYVLNLRYYEEAPTDVIQDVYSHKFKAVARAKLIVDRELSCVQKEDTIGNYEIVKTGDRFNLVDSSGLAICWTWVETFELQE